MTGSRGPTLTDTKGMGGIVAQGGFDQQKWDVLSRLPTWLRNAAFEGVIIEGLEDFEARFFAPQSPRGYVLDRFQAKFGAVTRADLVGVFESFAGFEAAYPRAARVHTLVTPALPASLGWIERDPARLRRARPFYAPFVDVRAASDDQLRCDLETEFGVGLGGFVANAVEIALRTFPDRPAAEAAFAGALQTAFPELDVGAKRVANAFASLSDLVDRSRGTMLIKRKLLDVLTDALGAELVPDRRLHLHVRSDRNASQADAIEIDASAFAAGTDREFPSPEQWRFELLEPLRATARWASEYGCSRIALTGSYRLSTALGLGWAFRSATGFEIDIATRSGIWPTDLRSPPLHQPATDWRIIEPEGLIGDRLVVAAGVLRDPSHDVQVALGLDDQRRMLSAVLPRAVIDGSDAQASVQAIKRVLTDVAARHGAAGIDLYYVGPAALAVALGHRWNAMPPTQGYEFVPGERRYTPTICLDSLTPA